MTALLLAIIITQVDSGLIIAPYKPNMPNQMRAPCGVAIEHDGKCWLGVRGGPPCDAQSLEVKGQCLMPVIGKKQPAPPPMLKRPATYRFVAWEPGGVPEQVKAPCPDVRAIWTLEGACWGKTSDKVPCPPETRQIGQACYLPVVEETTPPTS